MTLREDIQDFKYLEGETIHETWLRFKKLVIQCPTHGLLDNVLLQNFSKIFNTACKGGADQFSLRVIMQQQ